MEYVLLVISAVFVNNIILAQYLGNCPFLGCSRQNSVAVGMGLAVVFVASISTAATWLAQKYLLLPLGLDYLQTIVFILVIATVVQFVEMFLKKAMPPLYRSLGIYLPLITTNCAVLGLAIICQRAEYGLGKSIFYTAASGLGFLLALYLMSVIRERYEIIRLPASLKGTPIALVTAGILSLAFFAFKGMI